ncbi:hypothetical protein AAFF_G00267500 [Aldrovandia affinis]|uniref:Uncharacterized protein n=1 Tax=Aldrovandia affinis TaxID=143900 RepID=A0AAD7STV9_9TELE|nr:hypothetical protein AAFF_G00267500 [Aldrovandia affinis]
MAAVPLHRSVHHCTPSRSVSLCDPVTSKLCLCPPTPYCALLLHLDKRHVDHHLPLLGLIEVSLLTRSAFPSAACGPDIANSSLGYVLSFKLQSTMTGGSKQGSAISLVPDKAGFLESV